eukprot:6711685-Karenia_brevis.AAC.1
MTHRVKCLPSVSPLSNFCKMFYAVCSSHWRCFYFMNAYQHGALQDEAQAELAWAEHRTLAVCNHDEQPEVLAELAPHFKGRYVHALTPTELHYLKWYFTFWPKSAWQLNQDPESGHGMHSTGR